MHSSHYYNMLYTFIMCDHVIVTLISTHWVLVTIPTPQPTQRMSTLQGRRQMILSQPIRFSFEMHSIVINVRRVWHSPCTAPTIVHVRAFCFVPSQPPIERTSSACDLGVGGNRSTQIITDTNCLIFSCSCVVQLCTITQITQFT
jgi:hypothetical protein